jgi:UDP-N-acetylmuramate dehydrogenase
LRWAYRSTPLPERLGAGAVIVALGLSLQPGDPVTLQSCADELHTAKRQRQPIGARNAGCIFKNPNPGNPAGQLIEAAGCKGLRVGDAQISELHSNFLINHGGATSADVEKLIETVVKTVHRRSGHALEEEIHRW